ncbi:MAG: DHH family phosphoesterase, partial [Thermoleophilaceae bacterium]|nr:DHH family phosphoesterase [Thermoleophilaceae bacterium]
MDSSTGVGPEVGQIVEEIRAADKLLLTTHENPDGDALGSLLSMHWVLEQLGKDSVMYMSPDEFPLPIEYQDMTFDGLLGAPPEDIDQRVVVFLDCGNIDRMPVDFLKREGVHILNIDHHHDNTRFGTVNLVVSDASCTAEIVFDLSRKLGAELTPRIADAMYVGLVTDTGRFMYQNTTPAAHRMAADLIKAGVDTHGVYRRLFEDLPYRRLQLLARA